MPNKNTFFSIPNRYSPLESMKIIQNETLLNTNITKIEVLNENLKNDNIQSQSIENNIKKYIYFF